MQNPDQTPQTVHVVHHQGAPTAQPRSTSGLAVTSMILGILSVLGGTCLLFPPVLAVIFGHIAVGNCNKNPLMDGKGMGIAGLVMGWLCLAGLIALIVIEGGIAALMLRLSNQH